MSIYYYSFRLGELYEAIGSNDKDLLHKIELQLPHDPDLLTVCRAVLIDGLLYHEFFAEDLYNDALNHIVQALPSYRNFFDDKDYQIDYHDAWLRLPKKSLLKRYWGYLTHGRYLFDHSVSPLALIRYGYLTQDELPQFLQMVEQEGERLPWYFFQHTIDAIRMSQSVGDDLYVAIQIKGRRYRVIKPGDLQNR
ncbi:hypothetical protein [Tumebacillus permanentifrigoris]|uniref:Uncharacterized protein n=1 Tax=Tumebacillus permanentifrigoris TaxID=378543 RepID=A0A316DCT5_9BACL|nr:hypothetical protein [Tumebacillus permanentifrigoris]PWK15804.1 hypothetical protein C7459_10244 [Tumebacillus permanentifrigoris]